LLGVRRKKGLLFLKKEAKNFYVQGVGNTVSMRNLGSGGEIKVFWFFSSEKNMLS
jgi:hypothetical protein